MYYSYIEIEYVAMSFSPARTDLALKLLRLGNLCSCKRETVDLGQLWVLTCIFVFWINLLSSPEFERDEGTRVKNSITPKLN